MLVQFLHEENRLKFIFCVQVYRQVKTDKCAEVTQQTQCLFFRIQKKKRKIQQLSLLGYRNNTCFFLSLFPLFAFFEILLDPHSCTDYGVKKRRAEKRKLGQRKWSPPSATIISRPPSPAHTHSHARILLLVDKIKAKKARHTRPSKSRDGHDFVLAWLHHSTQQTPVSPKKPR